MDDLIKILQKLMSESPKPKGGIADTAEGIEFIGRKLTKDEIGGNAIIGSKLTDASRFKPFSIQNVGIENRYSLLREYGDDLAKKFEETIKFIKDNPDVRFSQVQKDNILYNLGVYRRVIAEKDKIAKGLTEQGKNVDDIFNKRVDNLPDEMLTLEQVLEKFNKNVAEMQKKVKETEDIFKPEKVSDERKLRLKRLYDGPGYDRPGSSLYRGYGSFFLPKLHEKGIIKLDDQIYNNLKEGQHHWGGATYYAPDPVRIWRKHFGNEVFEKLDNFNPDNEDIFQWLERNNIQPIQKDGPKNALEYLTSTELQQNLADETSAFGKYKNPESAGEDAQFFYRDKPEQRMERITYHGENIGALEQALQTIDPDSYKEYFRTKPTYDSKVLPFKELNAEGGRVGFQAGSYEPFSEQDLDINPRQTVQVPSRIQTEFDDKTSEAYRIGSFTSALGYGPENYENLQAFASLPVEEQTDALGTFRHLRSLDPLETNVGPFKKQGFSSDIRHGLGTSAGKDAIVDFISSNTPIPANSRLADDLGIMGANIASLYEEGKDILSSAKDYARRNPGITGIQDYDFIPDNKYLIQPLEDIAANYVGSKIPFGMSTPQKIAFISNYAKYGNQTLDQIKNLELRKVQDRIKRAEQEKIAEDARKKKIEQQLKTASEAGGGYQPTTTSQNVARTSSRVSPGGNVRAYGLAKGGRVGFQGGGRDASQFDFDPGPGEISSDAGFANTGKSLATQEIKEAPQVFDIGTVGDPSQNPGSDNVKGGIDYTPSFTPPTFFEQALGTGQKIINNPFVRAGIFQFLPPQFKTIGQFLTLANSLKTAKNIYDQSIDESLKTSFIDGLIPYDKVLEKEIEGDFGGPKPIDTESIITKKLKSLIPEKTTKPEDENYTGKGAPDNTLYYTKDLLKTDAEKEADYFTNLKENYFPDREPFNRFMMMDPDPKIEKDLLNLKNLDVQLTYPDQKVLNEQGYIDKEKLKSTVDQAEIVGTTNVGPFTFSRNIDTEGEGITYGSFDTKYLNIDSPNLEENQYSLTAKAPFENVDLSSTFNVQDGNVTDQRYDLNMDGLEGSYKIGDGFTTRNLELDKNFTVGNFDFGVDGMYSDYNSDDYNRYSSYFKPSVSYSQNIGDGILTSSIAKEMIQGGDVPNLSFAGSFPINAQGFTFTDGLIDREPPVGPSMVEMPALSNINYGNIGFNLTDALTSDRDLNLTYDVKKGLPGQNKYFETQLKYSPFSKDFAAYLGLKIPLQKGKR